jgi:predicted phosphodiesterase
MSPTHIRVASDLHLEAFPGRDYETLIVDFLPSDPRDAASILVLAGDISAHPEQLLGFLAVAARKFLHVLYLPGNHEYYRHDFKSWNRDMRGLLAAVPNVSASTDDVLEVRIGEDLRFLLTTLWGDGGVTVTDHIWVDRGLNDFRVIRNGESRFTVQDMIKVHKAQKAELIRLLETEFTGKTVVCTHHMPSYRLCHPRFGTEVNGGFASNCDDILAYDHAPDLWIFGHTHDTIDSSLWKTRMVCNPAGYRGEWSTPHNAYHAAPKFIEL